MSERPKLLDLYCGAGGASVGYHQAGFEVIGVDLHPQPHYPFEFRQADAREFMRQHGVAFSAVHASPPCQAYTNAQKIRGYVHPYLIDSTRQGIQMWGRPNVPYVIENVPGAPLRDPVELCGCMFPDLNVYRPRLFESNVRLDQPLHCQHVEPQTKMGRRPQPGHRMHVVGHFSGVAEARKAMGIDWMNRDELSQAIPPAYTELIGAELLSALELSGRVSA